MDNTNKLAKKNSNVGKSTLKALVNADVTKKKFQEMLGNKAVGFLTSLINTTNGNAQLQQADPNSILKAGAIAATLDLPIDPDLLTLCLTTIRERMRHNSKWDIKVLFN